MPTPAPSLARASSDGSGTQSGRWSWPVLGLASRLFEVALSGACITKGGNRWEHTAGKGKEKEMVFAKDGASNLKREWRGRTHRRREDNTTSLALATFAAGTKVENAASTAHSRMLCAVELHVKYPGAAGGGQVSRCMKACRE